MSPRHAVLAATLAAALLAPAGAPAAWAPGPEIVSVDNARQEQADGATSFADISGDGRYVVFQTRATNFYPDGDVDPPGGRRVGGVFRYDRVSGDLALVADGDLVAEADGTLRRRGAANPSVSADGATVAFSTGQPLDPADTNENVDVYVRDMGVALGADRAASGAYRLVSARDGTDEPPRYAPRNPPLPGATPGANVWPGTAISADGRFVAFRTVEQRSDLAGSGTDATPAGTVFVRDLQQRGTVLVSRTREDGGPAGGSEAPVVISDDGSTVVWVGGNAPRQTRFLDGEGLDDGTPFYLWRRWAELGATTRRPTGLVDLDDPGCPADGRVDNSATTTGPCYGALTDIDQGFNSIASRAPAVSRDGYAVAFLSGANRRPQNDGVQGLDLFLTDMRPGVTRKVGTRQLTADTAGNGRANGEIESVAMSADGRRLAFTSSRSAFVLPTPGFTGAGRSEPGPAELFVLDLATDTIERAVLAPGGGDADAAVQPNPSLPADGGTVAFTSRAANLIGGDANDQADAFVSRVLPPVVGGPPAAGLNRRPSLLTADSVTEPEVTFTAARRKDGAVVLRVRSPFAGRLEATASTRSRPKPPRGTAPKASKRPRRVARTARTLTRPGTAVLVLKVGGADGRRIRRGYSLRAAVTVRLTPRPAGARLSAEDDVTFRATRAKQK